MPDASLLAELVQVVRAAAKLRPGLLVTAESQLVEDLGIDSLDLVNVSLQVGDHFGIDVDPDVVSNFRTVGDVAGYVSRCRGASAA